MANTQGQDVKVYSVWVPILPSDAQLTVGRATKNLSESRVAHYWDGGNVLPTGYAPVLGIDGDAWDVYLLYDKDAEWNDTPPKPVYWQEQLGISDETKLDRAKLTTEINKLLAAGVK
ncbi:MAG: hypothetical protein IPM59_03795 [Chloracidobacterium sp.]|nr:hypothetical protein [Chloracidobacterium sp.]